MIQEFATLVSAAADIPTTRLFGRSPAGMSATGESDLRNYYDRVKTVQEMDVYPALAPIDWLMVAEVLGDVSEAAIAPK